MHCCSHHYISLSHGSEQIRLHLVVTGPGATLSLSLSLALCGRGPSIHGRGEVWPPRQLTLCHECSVDQCHSHPSVLSSCLLSPKALTDTWAHCHRRRADRPCVLMWPCTKPAPVFMGLSDLQLTSFHNKNIYIYHIMYTFLQIQYILGKNYPKTVRWEYLLSDMVCSFYVSYNSLIWIYIKYI